MTDPRLLLHEAHRAGMEAGLRAMPTPMLVTNDRTSQRWVVEDGACGFAWVTIKGNGPLAKAAKAHGWQKGYPKGLTHWVHEFNQSLTRKEAYAHAFAKVLRDAGYEAWPGSRMD